MKKNLLSILACSLVIIPLVLLAPSPQELMAQYNTAKHTLQATNRLARAIIIITQHATPCNREEAQIHANSVLDAYNAISQQYSLARKQFANIANNTDEAVLLDLTRISKCMATTGQQQIQERINHIQALTNGE